MAAVVPVATGRDGFPNCNHEHVNADATTIENRRATASGEAVLAPRAAAEHEHPGPGSISPWRLDWATLLYRVHDVDALACDCGGRLRFVDLITDPTEARRILAELGRRCEPPPVFC